MQLQATRGHLVGAIEVIPLWDGPLPTFLDKIPDRTIKAKAPDFIQPAGLLSPSQSLDRISRSYERLAQYVESTPDLRDHVLESPPLHVLTGGAYSLSDGYQWALTAASHDERHVRQIEELKSHPNYPAA